ncbi:hypothetical protein [Saccharopolyspora taberi]|uniref:Collagen-like protein n=1 Tax=Saccharopolyspora taberi TaxID=60895 RepID=A0ABN3VH71_9PSEU
MSRTVAKLFAIAGLSAALLMGAAGVANAEWPPKVDGVPGTPVADLPSALDGLPAKTGAPGKPGSNG